MSYGPTLVLGTKYSRLTVIEGPMRTAERKLYAYRCRCDCGKETFARATALKNGRHASCGCQMREKAAARWSKGGDEAIVNDMFKNYRQSAPRRGYEFCLTRDEFEAIVRQQCRYCGSPPSLPPSRSAIQARTTKDISAYRYNGVDRVDNGQGYTITNCVPCCATCNRAKASMALPEWVAWIRRVQIGTRELSIE